MGDLRTDRSCQSWQNQQFRHFDRRFSAFGSCGVVVNQLIYSLVWTLTPIDAAELHIWSRLETSAGELFQPRGVIHLNFTPFFQRRFSCTCATLSTRNDPADVNTDQQFVADSLRSKNSPKCSQRWDYIISGGCSCTTWTTRKSDRNVCSYLYIYI